MWARSPRGESCWERGGQDQGFSNTSRLERTGGAREAGRKPGPWGQKEPKEEAVPRKRRISNGQSLDEIPEEEY